MQKNRLINILKINKKYWIDGRKGLLEFFGKDFVDNVPSDHRVPLFGLLDI